MLVKYVWNTQLIAKLYQTTAINTVLVSLAQKRLRLLPRSWKDQSLRQLLGMWYLCETREDSIEKCTVSYSTVVCACAYQLAQYSNLLPLLSAIFLEETVRINTVYHTDFSGFRGLKRKVYHFLVPYQHIIYSNAVYLQELVFLFLSMTLYWLV